MTAPPDTFAMAVTSAEDQAQRLAVVHGALQTCWEGLAENAHRFTCIEADAMFEAFMAVRMYDDGDAFMCRHAEQDTDSDHHEVSIRDENGHPIGWRRKDPT